MKYTKITQKKRIIFAILICIWMITVFYFSNENAEKSTATSERVAEKIVETFNKEITKKEKEEKVKNLQLPVRKMAHLTLYTVGGILLFLFCNTYNIVLKKKILYAIIIGGLYAVTDEIHQGLVPRKRTYVSRSFNRYSRIIFGNNNHFWNTKSV